MGQEGDQAREAAIWPGSLLSDRLGVHDRVRKKNDATWVSQVQKLTTPFPPAVEPSHDGTEQVLIAAIPPFAVL